MNRQDMTADDLKLEKEEMRIKFENRSIVDLQQSCVQQLTHRDNGKLNWQVFNNEGTQIHELDKAYNEKQIFEIQDYAKKFELEAFNRGIQFMKDQKNQEIRELEAKYSAVITEMRVENDRVIDKLNTFIGLSLEDETDEDANFGIPEHMR